METLLIPNAWLWPDYGFGDHETLPSKRSLTRREIKQVSAMTREGKEDILAWVIKHSSDPEIQYKLLMQSYLVRGIDRPTVRGWTKVNKFEIKEMIRLHNEGFSIKRIALILNRCYGTVWHVLAREGKFSIYSHGDAIQKGSQAEVCYG